MPTGTPVSLACTARRCVRESVMQIVSGKAQSSRGVAGNSGSAQPGPLPIIVIRWTFPFEYVQGSSVLQASAQLDGSGDPGPPPIAEFGECNLRCRRLADLAFTRIYADIYADMLSTTYSKHSA
eukprot:scaffold408163_cov32-Prasinocladus_malaysianus.AAC.1